MLELTLVIAALVYVFAYPPLFVFGASGGASVLWILTAFVSPRRLKPAGFRQETPARLASQLSIAQHVQLQYRC
ncbi:MAG: hypothetical protein CM15mP47_5270 [Methanobacteriota archaeon]|nr:MAG: hypothetical protein CM15mP47_5270 [Euryarchaeota archaeon]